MNIQTFSDIIISNNPNPCTHYVKRHLQLYLTCKTLYEKYKILKTFNCDICYFRETICITCLFIGTKTCFYCICHKCGISGNYTGCFLDKNRYCIKCLNSEEISYTADFDGDEMGAFLSYSIEKTIRIDL